MDLITASILSKKLAAGLEALVLDVKAGSGAFLRTPEKAEALARALVTTANGAGCRTTALVTDQPLARAAGNGLEVRAAIACLRGEASALRDLTLALSEECLRLAGLPEERAAQALDNGAAAERFAAMAAGQGGPADLLENAQAHLPPAPVIRDIPAAAPGHVAAIDAAAPGHAVVALGGGRVRAGEAIDPRVGLSDLLRLGDAADQPLARVHAATEAQAEAAIAAVRAACRVGEPADPGPLVRARIGA